MKFAESQGLSDKLKYIFEHTGHNLITVPEEESKDS